MLGPLEAVSQAANGQFGYRRTTDPKHTWNMHATPVDAALRFVMDELGLTTVGEVYHGCGIEPAAVSRCRKTTGRLAPGHLLAMAAFSGVPLRELARVAFIDLPDAHKGARK